MEEKRAVTVPPTVPGHIPGPSLTTQSLAARLWLGRWTVLLAGVAFALLAMMISAVQQPLYRVQTSVEAQAPARDSVPAYSTTDSGASINDPGKAAQDSFLETQIRIIESRALAERVLAKLSDVERERLLDGPRFWWTRVSDGPANPSRLHVSAQAAGESAAQAGIIDITFLAADGPAGARFLNLLTRELADYNVERTWRALQHNRQWAERQIDDLRRKWEQSEQVLAEYRQIAGQGPASAQPVASVIEPVGSGRETAAANEAKLRPLRLKLDELNKEIAQWQTLYGPSGATVLKLKADAAQTEAAIRKQSATVALRPVSRAAASLGQPRIVGSAQAAHLLALQQDAASNRAIYEAAASRLKESSVLLASQLGTISVVDPAAAPGSPATPSQLLIATLGAFIGLMLGMAFVLLRERFSHTFSEPGLLGQYLGVPVLGAIPLDRLGQHGKTYDAVNQEPALQLNFETDAQTAEAFRSIRSSILLGTSQKAGPRRLLFTSAGAAEGTTFVIGNLGAALASAQRRVLLVDGNLRSPALHKIFGADNDHGLADLLSRQISEKAVASRDVIRETQIPDLYLLSAGQAGAHAPEILSSGQLPQLIREFAKGFDLVLVDSAPALPYSDARSLARAVDGVVLIVKAGSTDRHKAMEAREAIRQDGSPIIGAILTDWDAALSASA